MHEVSGDCSGLILDAPEASTLLLAFAIALSNCLRGGCCYSIKTHQCLSSLCNSFVSTASPQEKFIKFPKKILTINGFAAIYISIVISGCSLCNEKVNWNLIRLHFYDAVCGQHLFRCMILLRKHTLVARIWEQFLQEDLRQIASVFRFYWNLSILRGYMNYFKFVSSLHSCIILVYCFFCYI